MMKILALLVVTVLSLVEANHKTSYNSYRQWSLDRNGWEKDEYYDSNYQNTVGTCYR